MTETAGKVVLRTKIRARQRGLP